MCATKTQSLCSQRAASLPRSSEETREEADKTPQSSVGSSQTARYNISLLPHL